jgi:hypothetical protein
LTLTLAPVTVPTPLSILRLVAPVTDQLSVAESPAVIDEGEAAKLALVIEGSATTVTVTWAVTDVPAEFVAVSV